jgi:GNAT superfamily N-acetyltransferase
MFTKPDARKRGYGRAILSALHDAARAGGARMVTLLPSLMAFETGFYKNCGYRTGCEVAALLSSEKADPRP